MPAAATLPPRAASRSLNAKVEPINGFKTVPVGDGYQLASTRMALCQALYEEMKRDERVFVMGEEVAEYNGAYKVTKGLLEEFGAKRVIDTPITESGFAGLAVGAAMTGLRPVIEFMSWNFSFPAFDQIISNASKMCYMTGGMFPIPLVMRGPNGAGPRVSSQHSHAVEALYAHFPGLIVISPSNPYDAKGLLKSALRQSNPVCFLENEMLYNFEQEIPTAEYLVEIGKGHIARAGKDCTIVAISRCVHWAMEAATELAGLGIECEIVDPRTIKPLDIELIATSVRKTSRLVVVEECYQTGGVGAEIAAQIQERCFDDLDAPVGRVTTTENPMPYAANLEHETLPKPHRIVAAVKKACYL
ncbi:MAG: pyruvate dehydrogenase complex E1 component subunit beta [Planctomycetes bacterium]|nr:pyruvate dehydrogenase complex E1 component subunit beta [Planctomycetota bacterium]